MSVIVSIIDGLEPHPTTHVGGANEGHIQGFQDDITETLQGAVADYASGDALVHEETGSNMYIEVDDGVVYVPNALYDRSNIRTTKYFRCTIKDEPPIEVSDNPSGSTRIDYVCVKVDKTITPNEWGDNVGDIVIVEGTTVAPSIPANHAVIAQLNVPAGALAITDSDIIDLRSQITLRPELSGSALDGWLDCLDVMTYASAQTVTVVGDKTAKYRKGTKIRLKQGGSYKYYTVIDSVYSSPNTTITFLKNTDYTIANAAITDNDYSYQVCPQGHPDWFNIDGPTTWGGLDDGAGGDPTIDICRGRVDGNTFKLFMHISSAYQVGTLNNYYFDADGIFPPFANRPTRSYVGTGHSQTVGDSNYSRTCVTISTNVYALSPDDSTVTDNVEYDNISYLLEWEI